VGDQKSDPGTRSNGSSGEKPKLPEWALKTVGTLVGSLGLAGLMVVIGSAVLWIRFKEAGLPVIQAVSVQLRNEALVQGAQTTIVFALAAIAAVALLYVADRQDLSAEKGEETDAIPRKPKRQVDRAAATQPDQRHKIEKLALISLAVLPLLGILWAWLGTDLSFWTVVLLAAIAIVLTGGCIWMGLNESKNFWALAGVVFVSVIVFGGAAEYLIVKEQKFIQAVAVLRDKGDSGLTGFYVTADGDKLYVATPVGAGAGRADDFAIQEIDLTESVTYSVGPLEKIPAAAATSQAMLRHLIADREGLSSSKASLPAWIPEEKAATFSGQIETKEEAPSEGLCLMRYAEAKQEQKKGSFWTSCAEAEAQTTIRDARERLALPSRFQKHYEVRVKVEVPGGTKLQYAEGTVAPQCAGGPGEPCGHRYPGGGLQYWIADPTKLGEPTLECATSSSTQETAWEPCQG